MGSMRGWGGGGEGGGGREVCVCQTLVVGVGGGLVSRWG